ncbi:t-SNARE domain-containing protein 1-like [Eurosta solidaginis]|uniref:t-SNARE domain-containing protein 1-like n=1 Tax=Eurosta solidaginis TaxID=178769 RepID=UPI003530D34C
MDKKIKITNSNQFAQLVLELEKNPALATGFSKGTVPNNFKAQWQDIAIAINALGPPLRDGEGWQKVWRDLKCKVKRKLVQNKQECRATGGGRYRQLVLSPLEEQVANLLQFGKQLNPKGMAQGVPKSRSCMNAEEVLSEVLREDSPAPSVDLTMMEIDDTTGLNTTAASVSVADSRAPVNENAAENQNLNAEQNADSPHHSSRSRVRAKRQRQDLLQNHTAMQEGVLTQMSTTLAEIGNNINSMENIQFDSFDKLLEIEGKKLKLMERQDEREENLYQTEMRLKKIKLKIKEAELEILTIKKNKKAD